MLFRSAAEAANAIACARAQEGSGAAVEHVAGGCAVFAGVNSMLTHALALGLNGPVHAGEIARLEEFFRARGAPVAIDLCPYAHPTLLEILGPRGYAVAEFHTVLARGLAGEQPEAPGPRVRECVPAEIDLWAKTVASAFFERAELSPEETGAGQTIFHTPGSRCFLACSADGRPAAGAAMSVQEGLATLFADGTVPGFRNTGLHTALIQARVNAAIAAGCDMAAASTQPGSVSQRNYERLGFRVVYTKVGLTA